MAQVKPETDDKLNCSKQSHVVPFGLLEPGNSTATLPVAPALTQHITAAQGTAALSGNEHPTASNGYSCGVTLNKTAEREAGKEHAKT